MKKSTPKRTAERLETAIYLIKELRRRLEMAAETVECDGKCALAEHLIGDDDFLVSYISGEEV